MEKRVKRIEAEIGKAIKGKQDIVRKVITVAIAGGHILLDDIPGVGKTTLALAFTKAIDLSFNRVQFTPDVVPSDITGFSMYNRKSGNFEYHQGAAMCNVLLADEINRTSSKTQSALLEVMQEGKITVDGQTHRVPNPFLVIATQNPIGTAGTQMLPEAQLDRFMIQLSIGYPNSDSESEILKSRRRGNPLDSIYSVASAADLLEMRSQSREVYVNDKIYEYVTSLAGRTRNHPLIRLGLSPRASLSLCDMAQARAYVNGMQYVVPNDVQEVFCDVARHRIILSPKAQLEGKDADAVLMEILQDTKIPRPDKGTDPS